MKHELRLFFVALQFLTRVPVPAWVGYQPDWLHASARHFPSVGLCVGGAGALVLWGAGHAWPASVAVVLSMAATVWLTGAFHEDGLADTADALGGSVPRARALEIMKDSRIGTYGAVALVGALALKATALHAIATRDLAGALVLLPLAHAWSRVVPVCLLTVLTYAGDAEHAKAKPMATQVSAGGLAAALALGLVAGGAAAACGLAIEHLVEAALAAVVAAVVMARWLRKRLGGYTGDTLGASQQVAEVAIYLAVLAAMARA